MSRYRELNIERLKTLSEGVRKASDSLSEYARLPEKEILSNKTTLNAVKYNFILYHEVDDRRVIKHLKEDPKVIDDFLNVVKRLIESR